MPDRMHVIYTAANVPQAHLLKNLLDEAGIPSSVVNDSLQGVAGEVPFGWATSARVLVAEEQAVKSRRIAEEFDASLVAAARKPPGRTMEETDEAGAGGAPARGASCPDCDRPRMAMCPVCDTADSDFPAADQLANDMDNEMAALLICPTCDEPFEPGYLRRCEWCGHDFGRGIEPSRPVDRPPREPMNARVIAVLLLITGSIAGLFAYFALLL
ncbi:MAG TPA: DUF2007 domain-containing protein [Pirellulales bacterium]|nr:DUF2007 domain-containing protein [Pirellulales bacterium]